MNGGTDLGFQSDADQFQGRQYALRAVFQSDYSPLYRWATIPPTSTTWRFRGFTPSPEQFPSLLWDGVLAQMIIIDPISPNEPLGLVQAFNHDTANRIAYLSILVDPKVQRSSTTMAEGVILFLKYMFSHFDLRKIYAETSDLALYGLTRLISSWDCVSEEGRLQGHIYHDGQYVDLVILAMERAAFVAEADRLDKLISQPTLSSSRLPSFDSFVGQLPLELLPLLEGKAQMAGGTLLAEDLGVDSIGLAELVCWMEEEFGAAPSLDESVPLVTLQDLYSAMESNYLQDID